MTNSGGDQPALACSTLKLSEAILKTSRLDEMKAWYTIVLGLPPFFEHTPAKGTKVLDLGGQTRASDLRMCFFRLSAAFPYIQQMGLFEEPGTLADPVKGSPGLHHVQLMNASIDALCDKYEELRAKDIRPHRSTNHGPMTSFYYRDPDGNNIEITAQNFPTLEAMATFMRSDAFRANPSGNEIDPEDFVGRFRAGTSVEELVRLG